MKQSIIRRLLGKAGIIQKLAPLWRAKSGRSQCPAELEDFDIGSSIRNPTPFYHKCVAYFDQHLPEHLKQHRRYFSIEDRGFGEDAFHVMWALLVAKIRPVHFLEIGVYRGQVLSLVGVLQRDHGITGSITGIGPFERIGDAESVKYYGHCPDWLDDIRKNVDHFGTPKPNLIKAFSTDPSAIQAIRDTTWDMIYIDGNHDHEVVAEDWRNCAGNVRIGGVIVLDDSGLGTRYRPPLFASAGFPGPSKVANSANGTEFREILQVGHNRVFERLR